MIDHSRVAALRVPWFAAAAQVRREPGLAGEALVLGAPRGGVWRVAAVSAEAAALGVRVGMPLAQAESLCPTLVRRPFDPVYLAQEHERVLAALEGHVAVEPGERGWALFRPPLAPPRPLAPPGPPNPGRELVVDGRLDGGREWPALASPALGELARGGAGLVGERRALAWLVDALAATTGYVAAVGVAEGRGAAAIAARRAAAGAVEWVPPGAVAAYLAPLPAGLLPVSAEMRRRLMLLGLRTIGALAALPLGAVQAQFGPEGRLAWEIAHGRDARPLTPRTPPHVPSAEVVLDAPCTDQTLLLATVERLLERALREVPPGQVVGRVRLVATVEPPASSPWPPLTPPLAPPILGGNTSRAVGQAPARDEGVRGRSPWGGEHTGRAGGGEATWEWRVVPREPTAAPGALRFAVTTALLRTPPPGPVSGLQLELCDLGAPTPLQPGLFDPRGAARLALAATVRGLRTRFAANPLQRVVALDARHRLPERRYALVEDE